jgi:hypothetical protein
MSPGQLTRDEERIAYMRMEAGDLAAAAANEPEGPAKVLRRKAGALRTLATKSENELAARRRYLGIA